jgi:hypothetical protein
MVLLQVHMQFRWPWEIWADIERKIDQIMAGITDIQTAQAAEKKDLATLATLITQLLTAFASGAMSPAQAQAVLDQINAEDATAKTQITAIQAALGTGGGPGPVGP